jgi:hypothetical protein
MLLLQMVYLNLASLSLETFASLANGKISFMLKDQALENQTGFDNPIQIGGINENATEDNISPKVKLYMNDETFVSGSITNHPHFCWLSSRMKTVSIL